MRISLRRILEDHWATYKHPRSGRVAPGPVLVTHGLPFAIGLVVVARRFTPDTDMLAGILTAFSIFFGLLFNLLVFNLDFLDRKEAQAQDDRAKVRHQMIEQSHANITYATLVALATVVLTLVMYAAPTWSFPAAWHFVGGVGFHHFVAGVLAMFAGHFLLTCMGVLRRVYAISKDLVVTGAKT